MTRFRRINTQPAPGHDRTALGVAYYVHHCILKRSRRFVMDHAYTGREFNDADIKPILDGTAGISVEWVPESDLYRRTATAIAHGEIVGWFQGKMEWGPRALGNRSI